MPSVAAIRVTTVAAILSSTVSSAKHNNHRTLPIAMATPLDLLKLNGAVAHVMNDEGARLIPARQFAPMERDRLSHREHHGVAVAGLKGNAAASLSSAVRAPLVSHTRHRRPRSVSARRAPVSRYARYCDLLAGCEESSAKAAVPATRSRLAFCRNQRSAAQPAARRVEPPAKPNSRRNSRQVASYKRRSSSATLWLRAPSEPLAIPQCRSGAGEEIRHHSRITFVRLPASSSIVPSLSRAGSIPPTENKSERLMKNRPAICRT
jgi:hypothetical protein